MNSKNKIIITVAVTLIMISIGAFIYWFSLNNLNLKDYSNNYFSLKVPDSTDYALKGDFDQQKTVSWSNNADQKGVNFGIIKAISYSQDDLSHEQIITDFDQGIGLGSELYEKSEKSGATTDLKLANYKYEKNQIAGVDYRYISFDAIANDKNLYKTRIIYAVKDKTVTIFKISSGIDNLRLNNRFNEIVNSFILK